MRTVAEESSFRRTMRGLWFHRQLRRYFIQALFLAAVALTVAVTVNNVHANLVRQGMAYGWDFLWRATGWKLSTSLLDQGLSDPYWWTILMGMLNTLVLGLLCIVLASVIGCGFGMMRLSTNLMVRAVSTAYVDLLRNIPVIMQIYFWYEVCRHAPSERQALSFGGGFFLSNRGFYFPSLYPESGYGFLLLGLAALTLVAVYFASRSRWPYQLVAVLATGAALLLWQGNLLHLQLPVLQGFGFRGGNRVPVEFLVLLIAITLYSSAYVAEIVRGGLLAVDSGLIEAGRALGLKESTIYWRIRFPLAMRSALPPLSNQYLITMKVTSLGAAIGFADLFSVTSTSINHAGQTIELLVVMMGSYLIINFVIARLMQMLNDSVAPKRNAASPSRAPRPAWLKFLPSRLGLEGQK